MINTIYRYQSHDCNMTKPYSKANYNQLSDKLLVISEYLFTQSFTKRTAMVTPVGLADLFSNFYITGVR
jgi:hypothetical protein